MIYIPIHEDTNLTVEWWESRGFKLGKDVFYNTIRDASGRYRGFVLAIEGLDFQTIKTVEEALRATT